jgi:hypothetical protein
MDLSTLAQTIGKFAPLLGTVLAGPAGAAVGTLVAASLGGDINQPDALQNIIANDPAATTKLKQMEMDHQLELQRLLLQAAHDESTSLIADKDSARRREIAIDHSPLATRDKTPAFLAYLLTIGLFAALAFLFYFPIPTNNQEIIFGIVTSLTTVWISAMGYYHGSSSGSRFKDMSLMKHLHTK